MEQHQGGGQGGPVPTDPGAPGVVPLEKPSEKLGFQTELKSVRQNQVIKKFQKKLVKRFSYFEHVKQRK